MELIWILFFFLRSSPKTSVGQGYGKEVTMDREFSYVPGSICGVVTGKTKYKYKNPTCQKCFEKGHWTYQCKESGQRELNRKKTKRLIVHHDIPEGPRITDGDFTRDPVLADQRRKEQEAQAKAAVQTARSMEEESEYSYYYSEDSDDSQKAPQRNSDKPASPGKLKGTSKRSGPVDKSSSGRTYKHSEESRPVNRRYSPSRDPPSRDPPSRDSRDRRPSRDPPVSRRRASPVRYDRDRSRSVERRSRRGRSRSMDNFPRSSKDKTEQDGSPYESGASRERSGEKNRDVRRNCISEEKTSVINKEGRNMEEQGGQEKPESKGSGLASDDRTRTRKNSPSLERGADRERQRPRQRSTSCDRKRNSERRSNVIYKACERAPLGSRSLGTAGERVRLDEFGREERRRGEEKDPVIINIDDEVHPKAPRRESGNRRHISGSDEEEDGLIEEARRRRRHRYDSADSSRQGRENSTKKEGGSTSRNRDRDSSIGKGMCKKGESNPSRRRYEREVSPD